MDLWDRRPAWRVPEATVRALEDLLPAPWSVRCVRGDTNGVGDGGRASAATVDAVRGAEVYIGYGIARETFLAATAEPGSRLRWVHSAGVGVRASLFPEMITSQVVLTNSRTVQSQAMAETAMAMLFHFARGLDYAVAGQAAVRWDPTPFDELRGIGEVEGTHLGVVGFGALGQQVANRATALGMRVTALRRHQGQDPHPHVRVVTGPDGLRELLSTCTAVVICLPDTPRTTGFIGGRELALLQPGTVLVNLSRGAVLDEVALLEALPRLRGAALDVVAKEPLDPNSPLWTAPNVLLTPHVSATTPRYWARQLALLVANFTRYLTGEPLLNRVDKSAGY
ncbi:phosphoglycerate dehydrogenase-like enzyme [Actinokineospora baliensis]|uniref:D-2-hydroxyacid dehydrogenase n=1 Tax=Actinokineospora baliensis TaxID=547056 RepID=UPI00195B8E82|nr:D-2-hydroxyacid dehydrogenase [Actinokineospora baliensis]MBM7775518.1 phosphoglycerate dehydrogenase-like enzyme [Actinokineospora baliensis]